MFFHFAYNLSNRIMKTNTSQRRKHIYCSWYVSFFTFASPTNLLCPPRFLKSRYNVYGIRSLADEHNQLIAEAIDSSIESQWRLPSSSFPLSSYPQLGALGDLGGQNSTVSSLPKMEKQQPPSSFLGNDTGAGMAMGSASAKQEGQTLRHFFDEWPKARDSWPGLSDETASLASFPPATQLSMSIPMASSDFSVASSQSPNGESRTFLLATDRR